MATIIAWIFVAVMVIAFCYSGYRYVKGSWEMNRKSTTTESARAFDEKVNVDEVSVVTTSIISCYNDGTGAGPRCVTYYFLARLENGKYHELFSNKILEKEADTHREGAMIASFDEPYIVKVKPLKDFLKDTNTRELGLDSLFNFILHYNVLNSLGAFDKED